MPYRNPAHRDSESSAPMLDCPFCGKPCLARSGSCPHCHVKLDAARCPRCLSVVFTGHLGCGRCGAELVARPRSDATDAPCPRCKHPLAPALDHAGMFACDGCHGLFVDSATLDRVTSEAALETVSPRISTAPVSPMSQPVTYVKCPVCVQLMNRTNFGKRSGVIVDVCKVHGTWFDAGELEAALAFVARGGLAETRKREAEHEKEAARDERVEREAALMRTSISMQSSYEARRWGKQVSTAEALLDALAVVIRGE